MTTVPEYQAKVEKDVVNMDRYNAFINGAVPGTVTTDTGTFKNLPTLASEAEVDVSLALAAADSTAKDGFLQPVTIGAWTGTGTTKATGSGTFSAGNRFLRRTVITGIKAHMGVGFLAVARVAPTGDSGGYAVVGGAINLQNATDGTITFTTADIATANGGAPFVVEAGQRLVFAAGVAGVYYTLSAEPYMSWGSGLGSANNLPVINLSSAGATFDIQFTGLAARVASPTDDPVFESYDKFTSMPVDWLNIGPGATVSNGAIVLSGADFSKQLSTQRSYGLDKRVHRVDVSFGSTAARFLATFNPTTPVDSGQFEGSGFRIQCDTNTLVVYKRWDGTSGEPAVRTTVPLTNLDGTAITLAANKTYTVIVTKMYREYRVELIDPNGPTYFSYLVTDGGVNTYTAANGTHTVSGLLHGSFSVGTTQGTVTLLKYQVSAYYNQSGGYHFIGDSKTEGYGVTEAQRYPALIAAEYDSRRVSISGIGGCTTAGLLNRMFVEFEGRQPDIVFVNIGTNPEDINGYTRNIAVIARLIRNIGARPVFATVATSAAMSAAVKALPNITIMNFGDTMTVNGAGSTCVPGLYAGTQPDNGAAFNDGLHENALGHKRERAEIRRDVNV